MRRLALASILLLILALTLVPPVFRLTAAQADHSIEVRGYTWDHQTISVSIMPKDNESWWKPAYLNSTLNAAAQWNDAIQEFASNNTGFAYLSGIRLVPTVNYENVSGFDIYVGWVGECGNETTIGQTRAIIKSSCLILNNTVCLAAKAPSGHVMTAVDMQNIAVHEFGHTFGIYHCDYSGDAMYSTVQYRETVKPLSSLDLYALAQNFEWLSNATQLRSRMCPEEATVTLPSTIVYYHLQIADKNLPPSPQNLIEYTLGLFEHPEILIAMLTAVTLLAAVAITVKRRKNRQQAPAT